MKKFLALVLAVALALCTIIPAVVADVNQGSEVNVVYDRTEELKATEWLRGYLKRCRAWQNRRKERKKHTLLRRVLLAPVNMFVGTASASSAKEEKRKILREERFRRRKDNPGNGSAYRSAMAFQNQEANPDDIVKDAIRKADNLKVYVATLKEVIENLELMTTAGFATAWAIKQEQAKTVADSETWKQLDEEHKAATERVKFHVEKLKQRRKEYIEASAELRGVTTYLKAVRKNGNGYQRILVKLWTRKNRRLERVHYLSPWMRQAEKVEQKEKVKSFRVTTFDTECFQIGFKELLEKPKAWKQCSQKESDEKLKENANDLAEARKALKEFIDFLKKQANEPFAVNIRNGVITKLPETKLSKELGIPSDTDEVRNELVVASHGFESALDGIHWKVFAGDEDRAEKVKESIVKHLYRRLAMKGLVVNGGTEQRTYQFLFSSPSHQKSEKAVMCIKALCDAHSDYLYFGMGMRNIVNHPLLGAAYLKAMANRTRPEAAKLTTEDGRVLTVFDILPVKDVKRIYHHDNALSIGGNYNGQCYKFGPVDNPVIVGDGEMMAIRKLNLYGQLNGEGWKGLVFDAESPIKAFCKKHGLTLEEFYNLEVEFFDGRKARLGDYSIICGDGCWKFDKLFPNFKRYEAWIRWLIPRHPGVEELGILRQLDDEEGERKTRRMTRSLNQQWIWADDAEIDRLVVTMVEKLKKLQTMEGALEYLSGMDKPEEDRTDLERVFEMCPWLITNKHIQDHLKEHWQRIKDDAMGNRLVTKGQYPYIIQDPVALLEIWVLGKDPNSEGLGVLKAGEASLNEVEEGVEVLGVRFPANFLTARILKNRCHREIYESCDNCCVLSIYDDILIVQDGDVDGDEMCILYDTLAIKLTKRMLQEFNPPVIVFEHGNKAKPTAPGSIEEFWKGIGDALYSAHHNGQVGIYANLARDCVYLLSAAYMHNDQKAVDKYLLWMAAASTGAILAIDQVKGNAISPALINWLKSISKSVKKAMAYKHPFTQQFLKRDVNGCDCLPPDEKVITDRIAMRIDKACPEFVFNPQGFKMWGYKDGDDVEAQTLLMEHRWKHFQVHTNVLSDLIVKTMRINHYNTAKKKFADGSEEEIDEKFRKLVAGGKEVGLLDSLAYWFHNEQAIKYRLEGQLMEEAKEDLYEHIRKVLIEFVLTDKKVSKDGHIRTKAEHLTSLYVSIVWNVLELGSRNNSINSESKAKYAMFGLKVVAPWMLSIVGYNLKNETKPVEFVDVTYENTNWNQPVEEEYEYYGEYSDEEPDCEPDDEYIPPEENYTPEDGYIPPEPEWNDME